MFPSSWPDRAKKTKTLRKQLPESSGAVQH